MEGTSLEITFQDGAVKQYDMASLFKKYPQLKALEDRNLFLQGKLMGAYGIIWNDDLDIEAETIYEDGTTVHMEEMTVNQRVAAAFSAARAKMSMSQKELSAVPGIDQADISRIERGTANPSVQTLERLAKALHMTLKISFC